ncbi:MAG: hypothetical protein ACXVR9_16840, partial [Gaiellaceae bacterium]
GGGTLMTVAGIDTRRELAHRTADDIEVTLFWSAPANQVTIEVLDRRFGESVEFEVTGSDALDAFHHPYPYLASPRTKICAWTPMAYIEALAA